MKYMLLLYSAENAGPEMGSPEQAAEMQAWFAYTEALVSAGALVAGDPLQGVDTATTVRVRDGETSMTDGPFAETKEMLGGYYLIDVPDLDTALDWAAKVPLAPYGSVEVRPLMELPPR
ncbi:MAG TPA: YciI family protein [Acidimicrobiales bacterium]|nr:YciI family protein [Acidimicrobiales bacterium]